MRTQRERMLAGEMYDPQDPELDAARNRARDLCQALNATREPQQDKRDRLFKSCLARVMRASACSPLLM